MGTIIPGSYRTIECMFTFFSVIFQWHAAVYTIVYVFFLGGGRVVLDHRVSQSSENSYIQ